MRDAIRIDTRYDVARLQADMARVTQWHEIYVPDYFEGSWNAIALISNHGSTATDSIEIDEGPFQETPLLKQCPYLEEIIRGFGCPTRRVRLLQLGPGSVIKEHRDAYGGWSSGIVRMHVPIQTEEDVQFMLDGVRVPMRAGELWYVNVMKPHAVRHEGKVPRVHLVADLVVNESLRHLFPRETVGDRFGQFGYRHQRGLKMLRKYSGIRFLDRALGLRRARKRRRHARRAQVEGRSSHC